MNKKALIIIFLVALLVLPSIVLAGDNDNIALYQQASSITCYDGTFHSGGSGLPEEYYFTNESNYNWSNTIHSDEQGHYKEKIGTTMQFKWNCATPNITINIPFNGLWGIYVERYSPISKPKQRYAVFIDGVFVVEHDITFNGTGNLMPLYNSSNPLSLSQGSYDVSIIHYTDNMGWVKINYANLILLRRGNASIPNWNISMSGSSPYHVGLPLSIIGNTSSTMEIMNYSISINGEHIETFTKTGVGGFNTSGIKDMLNDVSGDANITVKVCDSYGYCNSTNYSVTITPAPDIIGEEVYLLNTSAMVSGDYATIKYQIYNNGTGDATSIPYNFTRELGGSIEVTSGTVSISAGQRINITHSWKIKSTGSNHKIKMGLGNTTAEYLDNNNFTSPLFRIYLNEFSLSYDFSQIITGITLTTDLGEEQSITPTPGNDTVTLATAQDSGVVRMNYSQAEVDGLGLVESSLRITYFNKSLGEYINLSLGSPSWIKSLTLDTTNNYIEFNSTHWSSESFGIMADLLEVDACAEVSCPNVCQGYSLYSSHCSEGSCLVGSRIGQNSASCGYVPPSSNTPPVINYIGDKEVNESNHLEFTISATDADGDTLTYSASNLPMFAIFDSVTRGFSWTPDFTQTGVYPNVHFEVTDGEATDSEDITITIININRPPVLTFIEDFIANENDLITLYPIAIDLDGDILYFSFTQPLNATGEWQTDYDDAGAYTIVITVSDGDLQDSQEVIINVLNMNRPPVLSSIRNKTVDEGELLEFNVLAVDEDNNPLIFSAINLPFGSVFNNEEFSWTPTYLQSGNYIIQFIVSDGFLGDSENISIVVNDVHIPNTTETRTGIDVSDTINNVGIVFGNITIVGLTYINKTDKKLGGSIPSDKEVVGSYYDISTTAIYEGDIEICINNISVKNNYALYHWVNMFWDDITTKVDVVNNLICGLTDSLSPFVVMSQITYNSGGESGTGGGSSGSTVWTRFMNRQMYIIIVYDSIIDKPFAEKIYNTDTWRYTLKHISELTDSNREQNLILVGGSQANGMVREINSELTYPFLNYQGMDWRFENDNDNSWAVLEIIDSPFAPSWKYKKFMILAGLDWKGTEKAVDHFLENYSTFKGNEMVRLI